MYLFETQELCKFFREGAINEVQALSHVSVSIPRDSFTALAGPSGSGKTTLLALLGALERPSRGTVKFDGRDLYRLSEVELTRVRRRMGFVFQNFSLIPHLPVWENITYHLIPRVVSSTQRFDLARALLSRLGLEDKIHDLPEELSGGEQQRIATARALAGQPEVLLADEPTSNLDAETAAELTSIFREAHADGKTVVVATHDERLLSVATHVYQLEKGKVKEAR